MAKQIMKTSYLKNILTCNSFCDNYFGLQNLRFFSLNFNYIYALYCITTIYVYINYLYLDALCRLNYLPIVLPVQKLVSFYVTEIVTIKRL